MSELAGIDEAWNGGYLTALQDLRIIINKLENNANKECHTAAYHAYLDALQDIDDKIVDLIEKQESPK